MLRDAIGKMTGRQALCAVVAIVISAGTFGGNWVNEYYETQRHEASSQVELVKHQQTQSTKLKNALELLKPAKQA